MTRCRLPMFRRLPVICGLLIFAAASGSAALQPSPEAAAAYSAYIDKVEARLAGQHRSPDTFLAGSALAPEAESRLRRGELILDRLTPAAGADLPGALLHHWRGAAFIPGAKAADFDRLMLGFNAYPQHFSPQVLRAKLLTQNGDRFQVSLRVRQHHILTVALDTTYDIVFGRLDAQHGYSLSRSTQISEIEYAGTGREHVLSADEEHGYLWRLNTYWSYEERDGGLYIQIETVSLTRSVPTGLGWAVGPFVESIPRESIEFTLRSACNALRR
jgi:hypothetical protein